MIPAQNQLVSNLQMKEFQCKRTSPTQQFAEHTASVQQSLFRSHLNQTNSPKVRLKWLPREPWLSVYMKMPKGTELILATPEAPTHLPIPVLVHSLRLMSLHLPQPQQEAW